MANRASLVLTSQRHPVKARDMTSVIPLLAPNCLVLHQNTQSTVPASGKHQNRRQHAHTTLTTGPGATLNQPQPHFYIRCMSRGTYLCGDFLPAVLLAIGSEAFRNLEGVESREKLKSRAGAVTIPSSDSYDGCRAPEETKLIWCTHK